MKILLIRHGQTAGNLEKCYIGRTDEPLCEAGIAAVKHRHFPACGILISSPMRRCIQTAAILFPQQTPVLCDALRECDFGDFEGKNYAALNGDPVYQAWIDSGGKMPFPHGESPADFRARCCDGFRECVRRYADADSIAFVVHGGTIMAILSQFAVPHRDYYDWITENAHGRLCDFDGTNLTVRENL